MSETCRICLKPNKTLVNSSETDCDNIPWSKKLSSCVPELDWNDTLICIPCTHQLDTAYSFRHMCLQSQEVCRKTDDVDSQDSVERFECLSESEVKFNSTDCGVAFEKQSYLSRHKVLKHTDVDKQEYGCEKCNEKYPCKSHLNKHVRDKHSRASFTCYQCDATFRRKTLIARHIRTTHGLSAASRNKCPFCGKPSDDKHVCTADDKCRVCGATFSTKYLARRHMKNVHAPSKNYKCDECDRSFASQLYLSAHKRYHSGERSYVCPTCGKTFVTASDLYHHEKIHANLRAYRCDKCPKAFNTSSDLHKHGVCVHADREAWKYACEYCERRFPLKTNLVAHTRTHTGERNFACHLCAKRCISRSALVRHVESHSNVRAFRCTMCQQDYKHRRSLKIHMAKVHETGETKHAVEKVRRYFCHLCYKAYAANNKLQNHIRSHTGERPFSCQMCEKKFNDRSCVKQHLKKVHNVVLEESEEKSS